VRFVVPFSMDPNLVNLFAANTAFAAALNCKSKKEKRRVRVRDECVCEEGGRDGVRVRGREEEREGGEEKEGGERGVKIEEIGERKGERKGRRQ
jgi:hypothetical protein